MTCTFKNFTSLILYMYASRCWNHNENSKKKNCRSNKIPRTCLNRLWFSFYVMVSILIKELNMFSIINEVDLSIFVCLKTLTLRKDKSCKIWNFVKSYTVSHCRHFYFTNSLKWYCKTRCSNALITFDMRQWR